MSKYLIEREAEILKLREDGLTFKEIGSKYEITGSRAREIYARAKRNRLNAQNNELVPLICAQADQVQAFHIVKCLERCGVTTIEQLLELERKDVLAIRTIGPKAADILSKVQESAK